MPLTKVSFSVIQVANNVTSTTVGNTTSIPSITFDQNGVITSASNVTPSIANTRITGTIIASQGGTGLTSSGTTGNVLTSDGTTWTSSALAPGYAGVTSQIFTSTGTFTVPTGITKVKVTVVGGGGSGAAAYTNGVAGGATSFGSYVSVNGGGAGGVGGASGSGTAGAGGTVGTAGDFNYTGGAGGTGLQNGGNANGGAAGNAINNDWFGGNQYRIPGALGGLPGVGTTSPSASTAGTGYGNGGGAIGNGADRAGAGGGGGAMAIKWVTGLTPGGTVTVTVGAYGTSQGGSAGGNGVCIVEY